MASTGCRGVSDVQRRYVWKCETEMSIPGTEASLEPDFDEKWYLAEYPDVNEAVLAGMFSSGLAHYLAYGRRERRRPAPISGSVQKGSGANPAPMAAPKNSIKPTPMIADGGKVSADFSPPPVFGADSTPPRGDGRETHFVAEQARGAADSARATTEAPPQHRDFGAVPVPNRASVSEATSVRSSEDPPGEVLMLPCLAAIPSRRALLSKLQVQ
jgi:hypothetical protein